MKILIIDMDKEMAQYESDCLKTFRYDCDISESGQDGLKMAIDNNYCCVILETDLNGGLDGFSICSQIRKQTNIPIVFISEHSNESAKIRAFGVGADDYITKPFSISEMVARVNGHITRYLSIVEEFDRKNAKIIEIRDLKINKDSHRVFISGKEIIMPVKEYELLLFLAENPNMVFSKEHLFDRVWGIDAMGDTSTVTVHIQRIREKIESASSETYIETVWGAGYRLTDSKQQL